MEIVKTFIMKLPNSIVKVHMCKDGVFFKYYAEGNGKLMELSEDDFVLMKSTQ